MRHRFVFVGLVVILCSSVLNVNARAEFYGDAKVGLRQLTGDRYGSSVFVPDNFTPDHDWPLAVILYSDESEKGNLFSEKWLNEFRKRGEIALFISFLRPRETPMSSDERVRRLIDEVRHMYPIDDRRVLIAGYGEAGHYAFYLGYRYPNFFSASASVAGGAVGPYETFFNHDSERVKEIRFLVLYGDQDALIQKESFLRTHEDLKNRGLQIEVEEFQGLDHQFHPQFAAKILDWFESLPVANLSLPAESHLTGGQRVKPAAFAFGLPRYVVTLIRGLFEN